MRTDLGRSVDISPLLEQFLSYSALADDKMPIDTLLVLGRVSERMLIVLFAGLSLWMGWKLFFKRLDQPDQTAEFSIKDIVVKLQKVAPGVMFAFFGAAVLSVAL